MTHVSQQTQIGFFLFAAGLLEVKKRLAINLKQIQNVDCQLQDYILIQQYLWLSIK